jgi:hypothetical protein
VKRKTVILYLICISIIAAIPWAKALLFRTGDQSKRLDRVDLNALIAESQTLIEQARQQDKANGSAGHFLGVYDLPKERWTPMIREIDPRQVSYAFGGVWLIDFRWVSRQNGFFIPPAGTNLPDEGPSSGGEMHQVKPGVYRYHTQ